MKTKSTTIKTLFAALMLASSMAVSAQSAVISVTTVKYTTKAPNVFAMWITNSGGTYITTINRQAAARISYLTHWLASATNGSSNVDGITGATLGVEIKHTFTWNCKNAAGVTVPDGVYNVNVEYAEQGATSNFITFQFTKGATNQTPSLTGNAFFTSPSIVYTAPTTAIKNTKTSVDYKIIHSGNILTLNYNSHLHGKLVIKLYNLKGVVEKIETQSDAVGTIQIKYQGLKGIFLLQITDGEKYVDTRKVVL